MIGAGDSRYVLLHGHGARTLPVSSNTIFPVTYMKTEEKRQRLVNSLVIVDALVDAQLYAYKMASRRALISVSAYPNVTNPLRLASE